MANDIWRAAAAVIWTSTISIYWWVSQWWPGRPCFSSVLLPEWHRCIKTCRPSPCPCMMGARLTTCPKTSTLEKIDPDWIFTASCRHFKRRLCSELLFSCDSPGLSLGVVHYLITSECQEITSVDLWLCEKGRWTVSAPVLHSMWLYIGALKCAVATYWLGSEFKHLSQDTEPLWGKLIAKLVRGHVWNTITKQLK